MRDNREAWIFYLTLGSAAASLISIAASEILLGLAFLLWIALRPRRLQMPSYVLPLCAFMLTSLLALAMSPDPSAGWAPIRKFVLFSMGLLAANFVNDTKRVHLTFKVLLTCAAVGSVTALVQFAVKERKFLMTQALQDDPMALDRVKGFMSHWMTFSGGQLLVWCALLPVIAVIGKRWIIPLALVGISIVFTYTRSAWLGAGVSAVVASFWIPRKELLRIAAPILVVGLLASPLIYHRLSLSVQGRFGPDYGRAALLEVGSEMVRLHPLFGVGLNRIPTEFPKYYQKADINTFYYGHLQNNFMQIAAERGLICFATFLWFLLELLRSTWKFLKRDDNETLRLAAISAMCVMAGFLTMGLFEYNFGDSEPLILFLFIVSIPFGVNLGSRNQVADNVTAIPAAVGASSGPE